MAYTLTRRTDKDFDEAVATVVEALEDEGFGVLCDIDVQATLKQKLDLSDYRRYRILGACNPALARDGLDVDSDLGALLPCNVVVYEADEDSDENGEIVVSAVDPEALLSVAEDSALDHIGADVHDRFERVLDAVVES
ncbi:DUF302 domain-containing protein [Halorussus halophilus]|uniref:DUF302 domain-containing protein n=1 Tax=Halorussus halophilus TaxID=2650975 RepID=UPI001300E10A|nr:DUF302 domain-containing protein [Halorussus halophilus]